jgi:hypothetical protein
MLCPEDEWRLNGPAEQVPQNAGLGSVITRRFVRPCFIQQAPTSSSGQGRPKASGAALDGCAVTPLDVPQWS